MSNLFRNTIAYITSFRVIRNLKEQETVKRADITPFLSELLTALTTATPGGGSTINVYEDAVLKETRPSLNFNDDGGAVSLTVTDSPGNNWATISLASNLTGFVPTSRNLTIDGVTQDLSADRTWTTTGGGTSLSPLLLMGA